MKTEERSAQEQREYLAGQRDGLRRQLRQLNRKLAKVEADLQAATLAAEIDRLTGKD